jgi:hypothetical protein
MEKERIAQEVRTAMSNFNEALADPKVRKAVNEDPVNAFLSFTSSDFQDLFTDSYKEKLKELIPATRESAVPSELEDLGIVSFAAGSFWGGVGCFACEVGLSAGIIAAFAGAFALTAGAAVAPLIAAEAGFVPVIAAMTGLSEATVSGIATAGGITLEGLIQGCCSAMGAC